MTRVSHHSHNGRRGLNQQPMTDRILVREEAPRNRFVDDCDSWRLFAVIRVEWSSCAHLNSNRLKVVWGDVIQCDNRLCSAPEPRTSLDKPIFFQADGRRGERKETGQAGRLYAGQCLDARQHFLEIKAASWRIQRVVIDAGREVER